MTPTCHDRRGTRDGTAELRDVAAVGPFFAFRVLDDPAPAGWRPFPRPGTDPTPLRSRIADVGRTLGAGERVAASIAFQGTAARLVAAPFAAVVLHGVVPDLTRLRHQPDGDDPWAPGIAGAEVVPVPDPASDPDGAAGALVDEILGPVGSLLDAVRELVAVSPRILRGNVASSLVGAARVLEGARPEAGAVLREVLDRSLRQPGLDGAGTLTRLEPYWSFRRRSCCLYYRVPGGGTCGDCVLNARAR